jgi:hypothetical protein
MGKTEDNRAHNGSKIDGGNSKILHNISKIDGGNSKFLQEPSINFNDESIISGRSQR